MKLHFIALIFGVKVTYIIGLYHPVSQGCIVPEVSALGRVGVWRLLLGDFSSSKEEFFKKICQEKWTTQPEAEQFMLTELTIGYNSHINIIHSVYQ